MAVLILDNFDSFTYNLADYIACLGYPVEVVRNDTLDLTNLDHFTHIVLSPGSGLPENAGCMKELILNQIGKKPILGVCLGMQALAQYFGETLYNLQQVRHGIQMKCTHTSNNRLFQGVDESFLVGLYHSWGVNIRNEKLKTIALSEESVVMAVSCDEMLCFGVQFHPESVLTPDGKRILQNFLEIKVANHFGHRD